MNKFKITKRVLQDISSPAAAGGFPGRAARDKGPRGDASATHGSGKEGRLTAGQDQRRQNQFCVCVCVCVCVFLGLILPPPSKKASKSRIVSHGSVTLFGFPVLEN